MKTVGTTIVLALFSGAMLVPAAPAPADGGRTGAKAIVVKALKRVGIEPYRQSVTYRGIECPEVLGCDTVKRRYEATISDRTVTGLRMSEMRVADGSDPVELRVIGTPETAWVSSDSGTNLYQPGCFSVIEPEERELDSFLVRRPWIGVPIIGLMPDEAVRALGEWRVTSARRRLGRLSATAILQIAALETQVRFRATVDSRGRVTHLKLIPKRKSTHRMDAHFRFVSGETVSMSLPAPTCS